MAKIGKIIFTGHSWPAAEFTAAGTSLRSKFALPMLVGNVSTYKFDATGRGKPWSTETPQAFWRSFSELPFEGLNPEPITEFIRRWGDPADRLDGNGRQTSSDDWLGLVVDLRQIAQAWGREDREGVSHCSDTKRIKEATHWWRQVLYPRIAETLEPAPDPGGGAGLVFRATNLGTFMATSSASALERRVPMRRCHYCKSWFELLRPDARFCRPSCRALSHQRNTRDR